VHFVEFFPTTAGRAGNILPHPAPEVNT
jgi:hypothetical protein